MDGMSIGEVVERSGVPATTLRYYERAGLLPSPPRRHGRRRYPQEILRQLRFIRVAQSAGFTLAEVRTLLAGHTGTRTASGRWRQMAVAKLQEVDELIERALEMRRQLEAGMQCHCRSLDDCTLLQEPSAS